MYRIVIVVFFTVIVTVHYTNAIWLTDIVSDHGLDVGNGLLIRLDEQNKKNATIFERLALRMDLGEFGITLGKAKARNAIELDFHLNNHTEFEGRGDEKEQNFLPFLLGVKAAGLTSLVLALMKALALKSLLLAKFALAVSIVITLAKLFHSQHKPTYVEIEQHGSENYPVYAEYPHSSTGAGYQGSPSAHYYAYNAPSAIASETALNYATVETSSGKNGTVGGQQVAGGAAQRREYARKRIRLPTILTVKRYTVET